MKVLEALLRNPVGAEARRIADLMRLPAVNHGCEPIPRIERFVFGDDVDAAMLAMVEQQTDEQFDELRRSFQLPCATFWFEFDDSALFVEYGSTCWLVQKFQGKAAATYKNMSSLREKLQWWTSCMGTKLSQHDHETVQGYIRRRLYYGCALLTSPRMAVSERVHPARKVHATAAERAFALRRAQQRGAIYSYNVVKIVRPDTSSMHRDERRTEAGVPKRMHLVLGHWRLIDGKIEPYWTWVESHERGNAELGHIVKERHVTLAENMIRRGFVVPSLAGRPGERVAARLAS